VERKRAGHVSGRPVPESPNEAVGEWRQTGSLRNSVVWAWSKQHGFTIVSKDTDFYQRAIVFGSPPKFIWLRVGNCPTRLITSLLRSRYEVIRQFIESEVESLLVIER
jgi:predicted nuclease of predicted toxin-antitoxin system